MEMLYFLNNMFENGVKLFIGGEPATPEAIAKKAMKSKIKFMPILHYDENGEIDEINYAR